MDEIIIYRYYFALGNDIKIVYADSEVVARQIFKKVFEAEPGDLLDRLPF